MQLFLRNITRLSSIDKLGTMKFKGHYISNPTTTLEVIDTMTAIIAIKLFPEEVFKQRNIDRARIIGRILWGIVVFLIVFGLVMSSFVILGPYKDFMFKH